MNERREKFTMALDSRRCSPGCRSLLAFAFLLSNLHLKVMYLSCPSDRILSL
jgi:hypothetical protein